MVGNAPMKHRGTWAELVARTCAGVWDVHLHPKTLIKILQKLERGFLHPLQKLEAALKGDLLKGQKWLEVYLEAEKQMKMFKSCLTTQEIFSQQKNSCQGLTYARIPIPDFCAPKEQVPREGMVLLPPSRCCAGMSLGCSVLVGCLPGQGGTPRRHCMQRLCVFRWTRMELETKSSTWRLSDKGDPKVRKPRIPKKTHWLNPGRTLTGSWRP